VAAFVFAARRVFVCSLSIFVLICHIPKTRNQKEDAMSHQANTADQPTTRCQARTEVYSRVCGFFRPVQQWNKGKQQEFSERSTFDASIQKGEVNGAPGM
jgi:ribonucleoside-triphosphate reductase